MQKILLLMFLSLSFLYADKHNSIEASYDVSYGIFGKLGIANASMDIKKNKYIIKIDVKATGLAKVLSDGKEETYTSLGSIIDHKFIPKTFTKFTRSNHKNETKKYTFDYSNNQVIVEKTKNYLKRNYDMTKMNNDGTFENDKEEWIKEESREILDYFATNDLLSLFFNIKHFIPTFNQGENYILKAVGANKDKGKIEIMIPDGEKYNDLISSLDTDSSEKFIAYINQKIFSSKRGELFISLNSEGFCNKAVLKDVLLFGDIVGTMTNFKIKEI